MSVRSSSASKASPSVLTSKLAPWIHRRAEVRRLAIEERLNSGGAAKLTLVRAPAGSGKTTTMVQLRERLQENGIATTWLSLDIADNDVPRFLTALSTAVALLGVEEPVAGTQALIDCLSSVETPFAIFLDEFESISEAGVIGIVRELLDHLPRNGRLLIGSRNEPDLALGRLRVSGQLLVMDSNVLRFSINEVAEFFKARGIDLSLEALDHIHSTTEGWPAALWLLSVALQQDGAASDIVRRVSECKRDLAEYLTEEVLAQQEPAVREFLLRTSILRQLSIPICNALLPDTDCEEMLRKLEKGNALLLPVVDIRGAYRYQSVFSEFLQNQLKRERPEEISALHAAASGWYEAQGRPVPAIDHAIASGNFERALDLLDVHGHALLQQGRMRLLDRWFSTVPVALLRQRSILQMIALWACCFSQGPWIAMTCLDSSGRRESAEPDVRAHVRALDTVLLAMMDRYEEAHRCGREGLSQLPSGDTFVDSVLLNAMAHIVSVMGERQEAHRFLDDARRTQGISAFNRMYTETVGGMLDLREGRLRQATARFRIAVTSSASAEAHNYAHGNAWAGVCYAAAVYEANDLTNAQRLLNVYLPMVRAVGQPDHVISSHRLYSRIAFERGDVDTTLRTLTELEYLGHERQLQRVIISAKLERSRVLTLQGYGSAAREELNSALELSAKDPLPHQERSSQEVDDPFIADARVELHFGHAANLISGLSDAIRAARQSERGHRALKLRLLWALAQLRSGNASLAVQEGISLVDDVSREGFMRLLLDEGPIIGPLVQRVQSATAETSQDPIFTEYLQRLIEVLKPPPMEEDSDKAGTSTPTEPLSRKEIRVLQLLAEGYSNAAMSEKLFVSDSTVRTHLRSINVKLCCHSRTQAVAIGRRLGLIP